MTDTMTRNIVNDLDVDALTRMVDEIAADSSKAPARFGVTTRWTGQTRTESRVHTINFGGEKIERSFKIVADEPEEMLGSNTAPNPQELLLSALNACMSVGYVAGAAVRGITLSHLEIEATGELDLRGFLDLVIGVAEAEAQQRGELAADGRLADAHHPDPHDRPIEPLDQPADFGVAQGRGVDGHCRKRYS